MMNMRMNRTLTTTTGALLLVSTLATAQAPAPAPAPSPSPAKTIASTMNVYVFPTTGQDSAQQSKDEAECYNFGVQQTGTDPFALQKQAQGYVVPDSFTHGSSAQRVRWFKRGLESGDVKRMTELFELPYERL